MVIMDGDSVSDTPTRFVESGIWQMWKPSKLKRGERSNYCTCVPAQIRLRRLFVRGFSRTITRFGNLGADVLGEMCWRVGDRIEKSPYASL